MREINLSDLNNSADLASQSDLAISRSEFESMIEAGADLTVFDVHFVDGARGGPKESLTTYLDVDGHKVVVREPYAVVITARAGNYIDCPYVIDMNREDIQKVTVSYEGKAKIAKAIRIQ